MDAYEKLLESLGITRSQFFEIGFGDIIDISLDVVQKQWDEQKKSVFDKKEKKFIRNYGRNGAKSKLYERFYFHLLGIEVGFDGTNNDRPERILYKHTLFRKGDVSAKSKFVKISNYQVSHIFGRTKNPLLFTALWNIAFIPKYLDPFTGHESGGRIASELRPMFHRRMTEKYGRLIRDYGEIFDQLIEPRLEKAFSDTKNDLGPLGFDEFVADARRELSHIV